MRHRHLLLLAILGIAMARPVSGQEITRQLEPFNRVIASPKINVILEKGTTESIRLKYENVSLNDINVEVRGGTLKLYLDGAKVTDKPERGRGNHKRARYNEAVITAYVTYTNLKHVEIRGDQELTCNGPIDADKFRLKAYGENDITFASVKCEYIKMQLYGQNSLRINDGKAEYQKYKLYGENKIDTRGLKSYAALATIYGESRVRLNSQDALRVNAFGEADVAFLGNADVSKGWIFGRANIRRIEPEN